MKLKQKDQKKIWKAEAKLRKNLIPVIQEFMCDCIEIGRELEIEDGYAFGLEEEGK